MNPNGTYGFREFLAELGNGGVQPNDEIYGYLSNTDMQRFRKWRRRLERVRGFNAKGGSQHARQKRGQKSRLVGIIFERLIRVLLDGCQAISHDGNIRTTTSEIDFRIKVEPLGSTIPMFREAGNHAIGEAKCVVGSLETEWINELAGLLPIHNANLGVLFTAGPPKKLRSEQRTAIALHSIRGQRIVPFGLTQIDAIQGGGNFLRLLVDQYTRALTHSSDLGV